MKLFISTDESGEICVSIYDVTDTALINDLVELANNHIYADGAHSVTFDKSGMTFTYRGKDVQHAEYFLEYFCNNVTKYGNNG